MPRQARIDAPGALHHIIIRGIERKRIFEDDKDREDFLERLSGLVEETMTSCYAWALMPNHIHLLCEPGGPEIRNDPDLLETAKLILGGLGLLEPEISQH